MNTQKFTQKSLEAIQSAHNIAVQNQNAQIEQEHLLYALLTQENGLVSELFKKMNIDVSSLRETVENLINNKPRVSGPAREAGSVYVSQDVDKVLSSAQTQATRMKDDFISVEHIMICLIESPNSKIKEVFKQFGIEKNKFLDVLMSVRGNTNVTTDTPEDTYDVLAKYGQDLVELAKNQKLDPVIGRDSEIRNTI